MRIEQYEDLALNWIWSDAYRNPFALLKYVQPQKIKD